MTSTAYAFRWKRRYESPTLTGGRGWKWQGWSRWHWRQSSQHDCECGRNHNPPVEEAGVAIQVSSDPNIVNCKICRMSPSNEGARREATV